MTVITTSTGLPSNGMYSEILNQSHINNIVDYYPTGIDKLGIYQGKEIDDFRKPQWVNKILDPEFIGVQNRETTWTEVASNPFFRQGRENGEAAFVSFNLEDKGSLTLLWAFSKPEIAETIQGIIQDASGAVDDFLGFAASELSGVKFNQLTGGERVNDGLLPSPLLQTKYILHHDKFRTREHLEKHRGYLEQIGKTASKLYTQQLKTLAKQRLNLTLEIDKKGKYQISEFKDNLHHKKLEKHFESKGRNIQNERISQYSDETTQKLWKSEVTRRELSYQQLHTEWTAEANKSKLNITHLTNIYADRKTFLFQAPQIIREWQIKNEAIKKAFEQSPYITKDKLVANLADASLKHNISSNKILEIANRYLHSNRVYKVNETEYVNHQILKKEEQNLKLVQKLHNQKNRFFLGLGNLSKSTVNKVSKSLGTEEKRAFNEITSKGMLKVLNTSQDSDNKRLLTAISQGYRKSGYYVIGAVKEAKEEKVLNSKLNAIKDSLLGKVFQSSKKAEVTTVSNLLAHYNKHIFNEKTLLIIDQTEKINIKEYNLLLKKGNRGKVKVILLNNDSSKSNHIHKISEKVEQSYLSKVKDKSKALESHKTTKEEIKKSKIQVLKYKTREAILTSKTKIYDNRRQVLKDLATEYLKDKKHDLKKAIVTDEKNIDKVNRAVLAQKRGQIQEVTIDGKKVKGKNLASPDIVMKGDVIRINSECKHYGINKGDRGIVTATNKNLNTVKIQFSNRKEKVIDLNIFNDFKHGYAVPQEEARSIKTNYIYNEGKQKKRELVEQTKGKKISIYNYLPKIDKITSKDKFIKETLVHPQHMTPGKILRSAIESVGKKVLIDTSIELLKTNKDLHIQQIVEKVEKIQKVGQFISYGKDATKIILGNPFTKTIAAINLGKNIYLNCIENKAGKLITTEDFQRLNKIVGGVKGVEVYDNQGQLVKAFKAAEKLTAPKINNVAKGLKNKNYGKLKTQNIRSEKVEKSDKNSNRRVDKINKKQNQKIGVADKIAVGSALVVPTAAVFGRAMRKSDKKVRVKKDNSHVGSTSQRPANNRQSSNTTNNQQTQNTANHQSHYSRGGR